MREDGFEQAKRRPRASGGARALSVLLVVLALPLLACLVDLVRHRGLVMRGVRVGSVDVGGFDSAQLRAALDTLNERLRTEAISVVVGQARGSLDPIALGLALDRDATEARALSAGRDRGVVGNVLDWAGRLLHPTAVVVAVSIDAARTESELSGLEGTTITQPPFEGAVVARAGVLEAELPRPGLAIDRAHTAELLMKAFADEPRATVVVPTVTREPMRTYAVVAAALARAKELTRAPVTLLLPFAAVEIAPAKRARKATAPDRARKATAPERVLLTLPASALVAAIRSRLVVEPPGGMEIDFDPAKLEPALVRVRKLVESGAVNAHFGVDARDHVTIVAAQRGVVLSSEKMAVALTVAAATPARTLEVPVEPGAEPSVEAPALAVLGVDKLVGRFTTRHPCCTPRVDNIHRIADMIDGVVVRPGETFSVNGHIGPRTVAGGFLAAPTIVLGEMEDTIGGGISQFATTLFNAVFYGGYDIVERTPHSFYFDRYPMGHEATLSFPKPDLSFKNDSSAGLLIKCSYTKTSITVKLYGDNGGRRVTRRLSPIFAVVPAPIEHIADVTLEPDEEKVEERGQYGFTLKVARRIDFADGAHKSEERKVVYQPRPRRVRIHPCKIAEGEKGYSGEACPEPEAESEAEGAVSGDGAVSGEGARSGDGKSDNPAPPNAAPPLE
ncbi:MAG: hypothetical protein EXR75_02280 [Myxococcales bacterium]|nr:hypothetical protein [Myxococcales bacterium]